MLNRRKTKLRITALIIPVFLLGFVYGVLFQRYHIFPYLSLKSVAKSTGLIKPRSWAIGIYSGVSPFDLSDIGGRGNVSNPVLTAASVTDTDAEFVADPFCIAEGGVYYLFFEVFNRKDKQGDIGYATSKDFLHWRYQKIILDEPFHLSYPYIFKYKGGFYMVPESHSALSVRLYKAVRFPDKWEYVSTLVYGYHYSDPDIFFWKGKWWLLVSGPYKDAAYLFYSDSLINGFKAHPKNPVITLEPQRARNGGRILQYSGKLFRIAQDCSRYYGERTLVFQIKKITPLEYSEVPYLSRPLTHNSGKGWNAIRMHHVCHFKIGPMWYACVDGKGE